MPTAHLAERAVIDIAGPEAQHFLQNIITTDLPALAVGEAKAGALLSPQGRIMFDFVLSRTGSDSFRLECRQELSDDLVKRLTLYRLRAKAEIIKRDQDVVAVSWENDSAASGDDSSIAADRRFPEVAGVLRRYDDLPGADATPAEWDRLRIAHCVAESGADYAPGEALPHDILFDLNGGVGLTKGCFVGQEVVSRMHHRGAAPRRLVIARGAGDLPAPGTAISAGDRPLGALGTVEGRDGLALVRLDRAKAAREAGTPLIAGGVELTLAAPEWAAFTLEPDERPAGAR